MVERFVSITTRQIDLLTKIQDAPEPLENYSFKQASDNIKGLADQLGVKRIILGGHDW
jgi:hypothetical protein